MYVQFTESFTQHRQNSANCLFGFTKYTELLVHDCCSVLLLNFSSGIEHTASIYKELIALNPSLLLLHKSTNRAGFVHTPYPRLTCSRTVGALRLRPSSPTAGSAAPRGILVRSLAGVPMCILPVTQLAAKNSATG